MRALLVASIAALGMTGCSLVAISPSGQEAATPSVHECPGALLEGVLARGDDDTAVVIWEFGEQQVQWPEGYMVEPGPVLRLRNDAGNVIASEGDPIRAGGGFTTGDELFVACGDVVSDPP
jgi:hypothetical protein